MGDALIFLLNDLGLVGALAWVLTNILIPRSLEQMRQSHERDMKRLQDELDRHREAESQERAARLTLETRVEGFRQETRFAEMNAHRVETIRIIASRLNRLYQSANARLQPLPADPSDAGEREREATYNANYASLIDALLERSIDLHEMLQKMIDLFVKQVNKTVVEGVAANAAARSRLGGRMERVEEMPGFKALAAFRAMEALENTILRALQHEMQRTLGMEGVPTLEQDLRTLRAATESTESDAKVAKE
jgi:hypothetical protein